MVERYNEITFEEWRYGNYFFFLLHPGQKQLYYANTTLALCKHVCRQHAKAKLAKNPEPALCCWLCSHTSIRKKDYTCVLIRAEIYVGVGVQAILRSNGEVM